MCLTRVLGVCLAALALTDAFIEFDKSRIYDEKDFEGQGTVYVPLYCSEGCHIYVSVPEDSREIAEQISIEATQGQLISLNAANTKDENGHKLPFVVETANAQVNFHNNNDGQISAPILVWIVRGDAPNIDTVEVYDADSTIRNAAPASIITVLDAAPFIVIVSGDGPGITFHAIAAGFDALGPADACTPVIRDVESSQDVRGAEVRSPLITFEFATSETGVILLASKDGDQTPDLTRNLFFTSPGYIGCQVKEGQAGDGHTKTFRSSLYEAHTEYHITSDDAVPVVITSDLNVDDGHAVAIVADGVSKTWSGTNGDQSESLSVKDLTISWTRNDADLNEYFLIRVEPDRELEPPIQTTTSEPEPEPVNTTTDEPKPEPEFKTTTSEPEPEPENTTTPEPEPEPEVKTTTSEPEPEPENSTSAGPEPEPIKTTTEDAEPEPDHTTTDVPEPVHTDAPPRTKPTTRRTQPTTTFHPKSTMTPFSPTSTPSTTTPPTTTSGAGYGSLLLSIVLAAAVLF